MTYTEPVIEPTEPPAEPEPFTLPEDFASQVQSWDLPVDALPDAVAQYKALQTEEGVIDAFIQTGQSLGFGLKELNRLFQDDPAVAPTPYAAPAPVPEPPDPDALLTRAEVDALIQEVRGEVAQTQQTIQQKELEQRQAVVYGAIDSWFDNAKIEDEVTRRTIAGFAQKHVLPTQDGFDPRVSIAALERGKAEYDAWVDAQAQSYLQRKAATAGSLPTPLSGGATHAGGSDDAPVDYKALGGKALDTARERVRARMRALGEFE